MPIDYARTAGAMSDLVSQPVNSFMAARDYAQQNQRRNALADQVAQRTNMEWQQQQQDRQNTHDAAGDRRGQETAEARTVADSWALQSGDPRHSGSIRPRKRPPSCSKAFGQMRCSRRCSITDGPDGIAVLGWASVLGVRKGRRWVRKRQPWRLHARIARPVRSDKELCRPATPVRASCTDAANPDKHPSIRGGIGRRSDGTARCAVHYAGTGTGGPGSRPQQQSASGAAGKAQGKAEAQLPTAVSNADNMLDVLDQLDNANGLRHITGMFSVAPVVPGTDQADAYALWEQVQGKAFLQAFDTLKGGGQITEVEGKKATAAITRIANRGQSLGAFKNAIKELKGIVENAKKRAAEKAGQSGQTMPAPSGTPVARKYNPETGKIE